MKVAFKKNNFDLIRLLAASQVIFYHTAYNLNIDVPKNYIYRLFEFFPGVPIFFITSGFLISASFERSPELRSYFKNRGLRIFPALWVCLLFTILTISIWGGISFFRVDAGVWLLLQMIGVIYTPAFLSDYGFGSYNGSLWTIPIELQFYVLVPILYFLFFRKKKNNFLLFAIFLVFLVISILIKSEALIQNELINKILSYSFLPHFYLFLLGMFFQRTKLYESSFIYNKFLFWVVAYVLVFSFTPFYIREQFMMIFLAFCVLSFAYSFSGEASTFLKGNDISYGVYLYHGVFINIFAESGVFGKMYTIYSVYVLAFIFAYASWIIIEKPMLKKKR